MSGSTGWTNIGAALHGAQTPDRPDSSRVLRDLLAALVAGMVACHQDAL